MRNQNKMTNWNYQLPDGTIAPTMEIARKMLGIGTQGFRALVRKGIVKKIQISSKTTGYEKRNSN